MSFPCHGCGTTTSRGHGEDKTKWLCSPCATAVPNAESYVTVADLKKGDYRTSRGHPQEGICFVCLEHGVQPFEAFFHPPTYQPAIQLGCGCTFFCREGGEIAKVTLPGGLAIKP